MELRCTGIFPNPEMRRGLEGDEKEGSGEWRVTRAAYLHWRQRREHFWRCALSEAAGSQGRGRRKGDHREWQHGDQWCPDQSSLGVVTGFTWEIEQHICR